jgi:hypothetical protein
MYVMVVSDVMNSNCAALCGVPSDKLFFPNLVSLNPPTLDQIQAKGMELIDAVNGLLNFETKAANDQPSSFVIWLVHVKSCVYGLLSAVTARSKTARLKYLADQRLHRNRILFTTGVVQPEVVRSIFALLYSSNSRPVDHFNLSSCFYRF